MALTKVPSNLDATVATTQSASDNSTNVATTAYVTTALSNLVDSSPSALNTLNELAAALNDDANFSTTVTNSIATKAPLASPTFTSNINGGDGVELRLGDSQDIIFKHHASGYGHLENKTGNLFIDSETIQIRTDIDSLDTAVYIDASHKVGIGTTGPARKLSVNSAGVQIAASFTSTSSTSARIGLVDANTTGDNYVNVAAVGDAMALYAGANERMRITSGGNVIINKTNFSSLPTGSKLNIFGDGVTLRLDGSSATTKSILFRGTNVANPGEVYADGSLRFRTEDASTRITFHTNSSGSNNERMRIDASGNVGIGASSVSSWAKLQVAGTAGAQTGANQALYIQSPTATANEGVGMRMSAASGSHEAVGIIGMVNNASGNAGSMTFHTYNLGATIPEVMRITNTGNVGIGTANPTAYDTNSAGVSADLVVANSGHAGIVVASGSTSDAGIFFGDGSGAAAYKGAISYVNSQDRLYMKANGVNKATLDTDRFSLLCPQLVTTNFWIGSVPSTSNNNSGAVLLVNLTTANANNVGFQFSGSIIGNSYTGQAFVNVNIVKNYSNDAVAFDVADDQNLNSVVARMQLNLCTITYSGTSYLAIVKNGGGTGTISLNGYFQGWDSSVIQEVSSGNYSITTNHGNLNF